MWIQILLVLVAVGLLIVLSRAKRTAVSAFKKAGFVLLAIAMIVTVLLPETTTVVAHLLGIGRGADLLLYVVTAAFLVYAITQYLRNQANRAVLFSLARRVAVQEAADAYGLSGRTRTPSEPDAA